MSIMTDKLIVRYIGVVILILWVSIFFIQIQMIPVPLFDLVIFGDRRFAFFDFWSIQHFLSGVIVGSVILSIRKLDFAKYFILIFLSSILWETSELGMEYGVFGQAISDWKFGYELLYNRLFIDPLSVFLGGLTVWHFKKAAYFAAAPLLAWFFVNVLSPNSMYVQDIFLTYFRF